MSVIKLFLCMTIIIASLGIGSYFANRMSERTKILGNYITLLEEAAVRMTYTSSNLARLFSDNFAGYSFTSDRPFDEQFRRMTAQFKDVLKQEDVTLLDDFTRELGASDAASQLSHIRLYAALLKERREQAQEDCDKKSKLCRILPLSVGVAAAVLLI